jgi:hypothetical protein
LFGEVAEVVHCLCTVANWGREEKVYKKAGSVYLPAGVNPSSWVACSEGAPGCT